MIKMIEVSNIKVDETFNCRGRIAPIDVTDLCRSIQEKGLLQPLVVCEYQEEGYEYRLLAGFRRHFAMKVLEQKEVECKIVPEMSEVDARILNLSENLQRQQLDILQEAKALEPLVRMKLSREKIAKKLDLTQGWVQVRLMLLNLPKEVQVAAGASQITQAQIRQLNTIKTNDGDNAVMEAAKLFKENREKGIKRTKLVPKNKEYKKKSKCIRKAAEMHQMLDELIDGVGYGLHTRVLAWAAGDISTSDLEESTREYSKEYELGTFRNFTETI